jgi:hypothetical protein
MDGQISPIQDICSLAKKYNAMTYIDEVHSVGLYGKGGAGIANMLGFESKIDSEVFDLFYSKYYDDIHENKDRDVAQLKIILNSVSIYKFALSNCSCISSKNESDA